MVSFFFGATQQSLRQNEQPTTSPQNHFSKLCFCEKNSPNVFRNLLRENFVIFSKISISKSFYVSNTFVSEGKLGEGKSEGFQTGGSHFSGKVRIVSRNVSGLFLVGAKKKSGKSCKNQEISKGQKGTKRKDKSRSGSPPCLKTPRLPPRG